MVRAVALTVPTVERKRDHQLFNLCRYLKAIPGVASRPARALHSIVKDWHRRALPAIGTKPFDDSWVAFCRAWDNYRDGAGTLIALYDRALKRPRPRAAAEFYDGPDSPLVKLLALCRELDRHHGGQPFPLPCREAGFLLKLSHDAANAYLNQLCRDGFLDRVNPADFGRRRAAEFRYVRTPRDE